MNPWNNVPTGREMDAAIGRVLGLTYHDQQWWGPHPEVRGALAYASVSLRIYLRGGSYSSIDGLPFFSTDLAAAWAIPMYMDAPGSPVTWEQWIRFQELLLDESDEETGASFPFVVPPTAAAMLARACLGALGVEP